MLTKKYALALSMMMITPVQQSQAAHTFGNGKEAPKIGGFSFMGMPFDYESFNNKISSYSLKDLSKLVAFVSVCPTLYYYFFHYPADRRSKAPMENIFTGRWNNVIEFIKATKFKYVCFVI